MLGGQRWIETCIFCYFMMPLFLYCWANYIFTIATDWSIIYLLSQLIGRLDDLILVMKKAYKTRSRFNLTFKCTLTHSFPMHPLSIPENIRTLRVFLCFQWVEKECIGNEWVNGSCTMDTSIVDWLLCGANLFLSRICKNVEFLVQLFNVWCPLNDLSGNLA